MSYICPHCKNKEFNAQLLYVNGKKRFTALALTIIALSAVFICIFGFKCLGLLFESANVIVQASNDLLSADILEESSEVLLSWAVSLTILKIAVAVFLTTLFLYLIIPRKKEVRTYLVCQNCGTSMQLPMQPYKYHNGEIIAPENEDFPD